MNIFIIYARKDQDALNDFRAHLKSIEVTEQLNVWYDGEILPGQDWNEEIQTRLNSSDIILLLISKDFFNSDYIEKKELSLALDRHDNLKCVILPVIVRACVWEDHFLISKFQALPENADPVYSNKWHNSDEAWTDVVRKLKKVVGQLREGKTPEPPPLKEESFARDHIYHTPYIKQTVRCVFCKGSGKVKGGVSIFTPAKVCTACKGTGKLHI